MNLRQNSLYFGFALAGLTTLSMPRLSFGRDKAVQNLTYASCGELQAEVKSQLLLKKKSDAAEKKYWETHPGKIEQADEVIAADAPASNEAEPFTNVQELGVDEEDFVKIDQDNLYVLRGHSLEVIDRKSLRSRGTVSLQEEFGPEAFASERITSLKMYSDQGVIAIIGQIDAQAVYPYARSLPIVPDYPRVSEVKVFLLRTKGAALPEKISEQSFSGQYADSRLTSHHLYLVIRDNLPLVPGSLEGALSDHPVITASNRVQGVNCTRIGRQRIADLDFSLTKIASFDLAKPEKRSFLTATLGGGDQIYMSLKNIYLTKTGYRWRPWVSPDAAPKKDAYQIAQDSLFITKHALEPEENAVSLVADGEVRGYARNQFHFKEYPEAGVLALATTAYGTVAEKFAGSVIGEGLNHLWILKQEGSDLKVVNGLYNFGEPGEDLRSVRFSGPYAYMVTFKKTDPLYVFNMSDPLKPVLEGKLKIPGFSMYLHPVGKQRLVGVGYDADDQGDFAWYQGVQVSLFDASEPLQLKRLDHKIHGQRGSYSDVTGNHHAFHFDQKTQTFTLPIVELVGKQADLGPDYGTRLAFSGALAYQIKGDRLRLAGRTSHRDLMPEACLSFLNQGQWWQNEVDSLDINRLVQLDGRWLSISRFGIKQHDASKGFQPIRTLAFGRGLISCRS